MRLDHIGIAVDDLDAAEGFWAQQLGLPHGGREAVPDQGVTVSFLKAGEPNVELLEPLTAGDGPVARFLERRGPGIHHLCFKVENLEALLATLKAAGVALIDEQPRQGAHGMRIAFVHPKATGGVLLELAEGPHGE